jgi:hypothetical protein
LRISSLLNRASFFILTYDHTKKFKKMLIKQQVAKTAQDIFMGLDSWDPAAKAHMMAYDMQLKDFTQMYDEETSSRGMRI